MDDHPGTTSQNLKGGYSSGRTLLSVLTGLFIFLIVVPLGMILIVRLMVPPVIVGSLFAFPPSSIPMGRMVISVLIAIIGLAIDFAAIRMFVSVGRGTQMPFTPTVELVAGGPYRYTRNPILLGVSLFYLGLMSFLFGWLVGFALALASLLVMGPYYYFVEEPQLEGRFGEAYRNYRKRTPFLFPRLR